MNRKKEKKNDKKRYLFSATRILILLGFILILSIINPSFSSAEYTKILTENGRLPATPKDALDSKVDIRDAFVFAGEFASDQLGGNVYKANHSYLSKERPNAVILYDGVNNNQRSYVWYQEKLNLNADFEFESYIFLSNMTTILTNGVPDGMTFTLQNDPSGTEAIGGSGGGLGVYPTQKNTVNMIYNAVAVEFDTFSNSSSTDVTNYDKQIASKYSVPWPHAAIASTYVPNFKAYGTDSINQAYDNFDHKVPTVPQTRAEGDSWFKNWKKVNIKWHPLDDGINGELSYTFENYPTQTTTLNIDQYFNYTNSKNWDRKVNWGFTGSNGMKGNTFGVLLTKLPQEPELDVTRKVRNLTKGETEFKASTVANVGDQLEYQVNVLNKVLPEIDLPLKKINIGEDLQSNKYVANSFTFNNSAAGVAATPPVTKVDSNNILNIVDDVYTYKVGESFGYNYKVEVGQETKEFINDARISSAYSTERNYGETQVFINPEDLEMKKSVTSDNPIVGEAVTYKLEANISKGRLLVDSIKDSLPDGMELVENSTIVYNKGETKPNTPLKDAEVWNNNELIISKSGVERYIIDGGTLQSNILTIEYQAKPLAVNKGKIVSSPKGSIVGTNNYLTDTDKKEFSSETKSVDIKVKTDVTVNFKDNDGNMLDPSWVVSTDSVFNGKNPAIAYLNTGDVYDYTDTIKKISDQIFADHALTQTAISGEVKGASIAEEGATITVTYSAKSSLIVEFVDENDISIPLVKAVSFEGVIGDKIDVANNTDVKNYINKILENHYVIDERPANDTAIEIQATPLTIKYKFKGTLYLSSTPDMLDFGLETSSAGHTRVSEVTYDKSLVVSDTRAAKKKWTLSAKVIDDFTATDGSGKTLSGILRYNDGTSQEKSFPVDQDQQLISDTNKATTVDYDVSNLWSKDGKGFKLDIPGDYVKKIGNYQAKIVYTLGDAP